MLHLLQSARLRYARKMRSSKDGKSARQHSAAPPLLMRTAPRERRHAYYPRRRARCWHEAMRCSLPPRRVPMKHAHYVYAACSAVVAMSRDAISPDSIPDAEREAARYRRRLPWRYMAPRKSVRYALCRRGSRPRAVRASRPREIPRCRSGVGDEVQARRPASQCQVRAEARVRCSPPRGTVSARGGER